MSTLLGYLAWIGIITFVAALIGTGGLLWYTFSTGTVSKSTKKIAWILCAAAVFGAAGPIANMVLR